jgi:LuxR family transcriptional regulator, maltose regulon positive regulatory protein
MPHLQPLPESFLSDIPFAFGAIERSRLLTLLRDNWLRRVIVLSAQAGYGKTTLAAQFARSIDAPVAWYHLRLHDQDPAALHDHIAQSLSPLLPVTPPQLIPEQSPREKAICLAKSLQEVDGHFLIVLDDLHEVDDSPPGLEWLNGFIEYLPKHGHLLLITRTDPKVFLVPLIARGEVWGLGASDLAFDTDDLHLLEQQSPPVQKLFDQSELLAKLDGWPAGIRLALQPLPSEVVASILNTTASQPIALFEQLAKKILSGLPSALQQFLMASSTLEHFHLHACIEVLGLQDSARLLNQVIGQNLFLYQSMAGFSFHPLFRNLLQQELKQAAPYAYADYHHKAAEWYQSRADFGSAFSHYVASGEIDQARQLADNTAILLYGQGRLDTLLEWGQVLKSANQHSPQFAFTCSSIHLDRYDYDRALEELEFTDLEPRPMTQRAFILQQTGHYQEALDVLQQIPISAFEDSGLHSLALRVSGLAHFWLGDIDLAIAQLEQSVSLQRQYGDVSRLSHILQDLQMVYHHASRMDDAAVCLQEIVTLRRGLGGAAGIALALHNLGDHHHQQSNYEAALDALQEGIHVIAESRSRRIEGALKWTLGNIKRDLGMFDAAKLYYEQACMLCSKQAEPQIHVGILLHMAYLERWQQNLEAALHLTEEALKLAEQHRMRLAPLLAKAHRWALKCLLQQGEGLEDITEVITSLREQKSLLPLLRILAYFADVHLALHDSDSAMMFIRDAVQIADTLHTAQPLAGEMVHSLRLSMLIPSHLSLYTRQVDLDFQALQSWIQSSDDSANFASASEPVYSLKVFTLGQERILRNRNFIPVSSWRGAQSRKLFFHLLFEGPQSRSAAACVLWPETSEEQSRENFDTTLYQARKALGRDVILLEEGRYFINPDIHVWCDAVEVGDAVKTARLLSVSAPYSTQLLEKVTKLYQGEFLPDIDEAWTAPIREKLRDDYLFALKRLGQASRLAHAPDEAIRYWKQFLDIDPFDDEVMLLMLQSYALDLGKRQVAVEYYLRFKDLLEAELGLLPSQEMQDFMSQLMS